MTLSPAVLLVTLALGLAGPVQDKGATSNDAAIIEKQLPSYPLDKCVISGESLTSMGEPVSLVHEGRLVRFCCKDCVKDFKKDPAPSLKKIDEGVVAAQKASYPLDVCPISGEKLSSMGEPVDYVQGTRLVRFCCKNCIKKFQAEPDKAMAKIDEALITAQKKSYPLDTCVVSGKKIEAGVDMLYGTKLVRFCCKQCPDAFKKEPQKYVAKLEEAGKKAGTK